MDTLTHAFIGMAIGGAVWAAPVAGAAPDDALVSGNADAAPVVSPFLRRAAIVGAVCAALPDVDIFLRSLGIEHRAWTHAWLTLAIAAPLLALAARRWLDGRFWRTLALVAVALFSHTFLDCMNGFGTQALLPFSVRMVAWDALPIVDPLFVLPAIVAAVAILASGGARRRGGRVAGRLATAAVVWALFYSGLALWERDQALAIVKTLPPPDMEINDWAEELSTNDGKDGSPAPIVVKFAPNPSAVFCRANPQTGTVFLWRVVRRQGWAATIAYVDTLRRRVLYRRDCDLFGFGVSDDALALMKEPALRPFLLRAGMQVCREKAEGVTRTVLCLDERCLLDFEEDGTHVVMIDEFRGTHHTFRTDETPGWVALIDLRYGLLTRPEEALFKVKVDVDRDGKPLNLPRRWMPRVRVNFKDELAATWRILCGGEMPGGAGAAAPQR